MHFPSITSIVAVTAAFLANTVWSMPSSSSFHEEMAANRTHRSSDTKDFRFLTNKTSKYRVESLPEVNFDIGEMYSGLIPVDKSKNESRELFFVFQPTIGTPVDEITIFLNGGPGCSSLQAFLQENGRFLWTPGTFAPVENPYSWVNLTNMLWVDQPIGTGYSVGTPTAVSQEETAQDFVKFFKNFGVLFGIKKFKIYLAGESYAGRYVPYISAAFIEQQDTEYFDLQGALLYDPTIGAALTTQLMVPTYPTVKENNNLFTFNQSQLGELEELHKSCDFEAYIDKYLTFPASGVQPVSSITEDCDVVTWTLNRTLPNNPCFSMYDISSTCPILWDVLGAPTILSYVPNGAEIYFDRPDVQKALHAPNVRWLECTTSKVYLGGNGAGGPEAKGDLSPDPIQHVLPQVIEHTNRVLVSNGDYDMIVQTNGTLLSIQNMTWNGKLGFDERPSKPINIQTPDLMYQKAFQESTYVGLDGPQGEMGVQHYERGLMWAETYQAGHMQPQYQPRVSLRHLEWVLGRIEEL